MKPTISFIRIGIVALLIGAYGNLMAQNGDSYVTFKGALKDGKTKESLVFATVTLPETHIGTVSNSDGDFALKVPKTHTSKSILITHLGYKNKVVELSSLKPDNGNVIFLEPASVNLDEITVRPLDAQKIVLDALQKVPYNYSNRPNMLLGFYRETIKQRRDYVSISEAVVDIYKAPYKSAAEGDRVRIFKGRKSSNVKRSDTLAVKLQGGPNVSLLLDIAKNHDLLLFDETLNLYNFTFDDLVTIDNTMCYVISFSQKSFVLEPLYFGKLYIDTKNLAIVMAQFSLNIEDKDKAASMFVKKKPYGVKFYPTSTSYLVTYKQQNGFYYLNYARNEVKFKCTWPKRIFSSNYTINSELAITDREVDNTTRLTYRESFRSNDVFSDAVTAFNDENFWGEYNVIEPDEAIESAIKKYGKRLKRQ
jgi:hypothetical protein